MIDLSSVLPGWTAVEKIGEGSYGKVYRCVNNDGFGISDECAVKVISIPMDESERREAWSENPSEYAVKLHFREIVENFANEIKLMLALNGSPNVVTVRSYKIIERQNEIGWDIYICMDYLTPFTVFSANKKLTETEIKKFGIDLCSALEVCSKYGIIHRDIKPDNIFVDKFGNYRLGDFGVARQLESSTASMTRIGTLRYMAPEVYDGRKYDSRADIYSLGMVMYKLLNNGRDPLTNPHKPYLTDKEVSAASEMRRRGAALPAPCNAGAELSRIIIKACEFNPDYRYSSASEFRKELEQFVPGRAQQPKPNPVQPVQNQAARSYAPVEPPMPLGSVLNQTPPQMQVQYQLPVQAYPQQAPVQKKKSKAPVIVACILCIAIIAAVAAIFLIDKDGADSGSAEKETHPVTLAKHEKDETESENNIYADYYNQAYEAYNEADYGSAAILFGKAGDYSDAKKNSKELWGYIIKNTTVSAGYEHSVALKSDGTVYATGNNESGCCNVNFWSDIVDVSAGAHHTVGLRSDGTVVAVGNNEHGQCNVTEWTDIVAVSAGGYHTLGLKSDGTVVATGLTNHGRCDVAGWSDIVAISAGSDHSVGLKSDGTVVAAGFKNDGQCNVSGWTDIVAISAGMEHTVALKKDGSVVAAGSNKYGQCKVGSWQNITSISAGGYHTVALDSVGNIVATGSNESGQCNVSGQGGTVSVAAGWDHSVVLRSNGTAVAAGKNDFGQGNVSSWSRISHPQ